MEFQPTAKILNAEVLPHGNMLNKHIKYIKKFKKNLIKLCDSFLMSRSKCYHWTSQQNPLPLVTRQLVTKPICSYNAATGIGNRVLSL